MTNLRPATLVAAAVIVATGLASCSKPAPAPEPPSASAWIPKHIKLIGDAKIDTITCVPSRSVVDTCTVTGHGLIVREDMPDGTVRAVTTDKIVCFYDTRDESSSVCPGIDWPREHDDAQ